jgi:ABC-2 type transport system permease protein
MRILDLTLKDLSQVFRDKKSLLFLVAMPIVFTLFMGFSYKSGDSGPKDMRLALAWVETGPGTTLSQELFARLEASDALKPARMEQTAALDALQKGQLDGILIIPSGYELPANGSQVPQLKLVTDTGSTKGQALYQVLRAPVTQLMSAVEIAQISAGIAGRPAEAAPAFDLAWSKWNASARVSRIRLEQAVAPKTASWYGDNPYNQASPGILVQFAIFGLVTSAQILMQERKTRTLQRLMTTSLPAWQIVAGHLLAMFSITFLQTLMLLIFGQWVLHVNYLREPLGTLLVAVALGLWVSSMGLLIGLLAKGDDQVILFSMLAMFIFSALGGTWFPLDVSGGAFASIGRMMPSAWAMTGLQNILIRGQGLSSAWLPAGALLLYALGFFGLAVWRFRKVSV